MPDSLMEGLEEFLVDEITIEPYVSQTGFGDKSYGAPVTLKCRITGKHKIVRNAAGQERVSTVQVLLERPIGVTAKDRFTLPARFNLTEPVPVAVRQATDETGLHHERIMF